MDDYDERLKDARKDGFNAGRRNEPNSIPYYEDANLDTEWHAGFQEGQKYAGKELEDFGFSGQEEAETTVKRLRSQLARCGSEMDQHFAKIREITAKVENHKKGIDILAKDEMILYTDEMIRHRRELPLTAKRALEVYGKLKSHGFGSDELDQQMQQVKKIADG